MQSPSILDDALISRIKRFVPNDLAVVRALNTIAHHSDWSKESISELAPATAIIFGKLEAAKQQVWDEARPMFTHFRTLKTGAKEEITIAITMNDFENIARQYAQSKEPNEVRLAEAIHNLESKGVPENLRTKTIRQLLQFCEIEESRYVLEQELLNAFSVVGHHIAWKRALEDEVMKLKQTPSLEGASPTQRIETVIPSPPAMPQSEVISFATLATQAKARRLLFGDGINGWNATEMTDPFGKDGEYVQHTRIHERMLPPNTTLSPELIEAIKVQLGDLGCKNIHVGMAKRISSEGEIEVPRIWVESDNFNIQLKIACESANLISS